VEIGMAVVSTRLNSSSCVSCTNAPGIMSPNHNTLILKSLNHVYYYLQKKYQEHNNDCTNCEENDTATQKSISTARKCIVKNYIQRRAKVSNNETTYTGQTTLYDEKMHVRNGQKTITEVPEIQKYV